jgi:hypothetical protein
MSIEETPIRIGTIKVLVGTISYEPVLEYYNSHKEAHEPPLQRLDRVEGGFKIDIPELKDKYIDENYKIQQLRWSRGYLKSMEYFGFNGKQTLLLYHAIANALGENNVLLI